MNEESLQSGVPSHPASLTGLLDVRRAAKLLGISPKTLRAHVLHRRIDYVKVGGRVLFRPEILLEYIERHTVHAICSCGGIQ